jgi:phosphoribosyl-ATP pyrophosphohydrolase/phosphoribosyl-AMP cyclohydrolase/histidinol dehydrogenase
MTRHLLRRVEPEDLDSIRTIGSAEQIEARVEQILVEIEQGGEVALRRWAEELGDLERDAPLVVSGQELSSSLDRVTTEQRAVLERVAERIRQFAGRQRAALGDVEQEIPGGRVGHRVVPVEVAGCYAPGGRYPLPSSVLMTAVTARAAGVGHVWLASPRPTPETLAAAAVAGVDGLLAVGGAQAVAALAYGIGGVQRCDVVVGPGNVWVTAAKRMLVGEVGIDILAGPSELVILADESADPSLIAADLLAQAEHDVEALPILVTPDGAVVEAVEQALEEQLADLPTARIARVALSRGCAVLADDIEQSIVVANRLAPEHLQIMTREPNAVGSRCRHFGGLFVGAMTPEVLGDYGAGPNHTLPTGGTARFASGLSVLDFSTVRTWIEIDSTDAARELYEDAAALAQMEGLEAHRRAAERRITEAGEG